MAGEGHLVVRGEDPHARVGAVDGRHEECRLRQVELAGDALHLVLGEVRRVLDDGERVARERVPRLGEDVEQPVGQAHGLTLSD